MGARKLLMIQSLRSLVESGKSIKDAAAIMQVCERTAYRWIKSSKVDGMAMAEVHRHILSATVLDAATVGVKTLEKACLEAPEWRDRVSAARALLDRALPPSDAPTVKVDQSTHQTHVDLRGITDQALKRLLLTPPEKPIEIPWVSAPSQDVQAPMDTGLTDSTIPPAHEQSPSP